MEQRIIGTLAVLAAFAAAPARASEDTAYWQNLNLTVNLSEQFRVSSETSLRSSDARGLYQLQQVFMLGYRPVRNVTVAAGYVHTPQYSHGDFTVMERRFRQQVSIDDIAKAGPFKISTRIRSEQRWREGASGTAWRLRPSIRTSAPLAGKINLNLNHESFINLTTTSFQRQTGYDRMRNTAAFSVPASRRLGVEIGYTNQRAIVRGGPDSTDHVLVTSLNATF